MPALARSSVGHSVTSSPWKWTLPAVTSYSGDPRRVLPSVLLPDPLGPMIAWTSPAFTVRSSPRRISSAVGAPGSVAGRAWRPSTWNNGVFVTGVFVDDMPSSLRCERRDYHYADRRNGASEKWRGEMRIRIGRGRRQVVNDVDGDLDRELDREPRRRRERLAVRGDRARVPRARVERCSAVDDGPRWCCSRPEPGRRSHSGRTR